MANRFLTTHVGSLPRPDDLIEIMFAREDGIPIDRAALAARVESAVDEAVARQVAAGVDIVNDGEWPKPSYATRAGGGAPPRVRVDCERRHPVADRLPGPGDGPALSNMRI